jgi:saccharopine dehydrogenase-like NADP-dependent oxidoreductase
MLREEAIDVKGTKIVPREFTEAIFTRALDFGDDDWVLVRVIAEGGGESVVYEIMDRKDPATDHSAMMRTTGYPTSIAALFLARGVITKRGVLPGEVCIPIQPLIDELAARGVRVERR